MIYVLTIGEYSDFEVVGIFKGPIGADIAAIRKEWAKLYKEQNPNARWLGVSRETIARRWLAEHTPDFEELDYQEMWIGEDWGT